jgi:hypothetical protein
LIIAEKGNDRRLGFERSRAYETVGSMPRHEIAVADSLSPHSMTHDAVRLA